MKTYMKTMMTVAVVTMLEMAAVAAPHGGPRPSGNGGPGGGRQGPGGGRPPAAGHMEPNRGGPNGGFHGDRPGRGPGGFHDNGPRPDRPRGGWSVGHGTACMPPPPPPPVIRNPFPAGHYEEVTQEVWVEGRWVNSVDAFGGVTRVWQPGHYEERSFEIWVNL